MPGTRTVRRAPGTAPPAASTASPAGSAPPASDRPYDVEAELDELDAETIAAQLRRARDPGLHWADDDES